MRMSNSLIIHALSMTGGATLGAIADDKDRGQGALIGAGVGMLGASGYRLYRNFKSPIGQKFTKILKAIPGKGALGVTGITVGAAAFGFATNPNAYQRAGVAQANPLGVSDESEVQYENYKYSLTDRIATMNSGGDLVLGLHNLRHG